MKDILEGVELSEEQARDFVKKLNEWKTEVQENAEKKLEILSEEVESKSEEKYSALFTEAKEKMQEVFAHRLDESVKELYDVVKERTEKDIKSSPDFKLLEQVKEIIAPAIVEEGQKSSLVAKKEELAQLQEEITSMKAEKKLVSLTKDLPAKIQEEIREAIGEIVSEDQVVEEFDKAVKLMKMTKEQLESEGYTVKEGIDPNPDPADAIDPDGTPDGKDKTKKGKKNESLEFDDETIEKILAESENDEGTDVITEEETPVNTPDVYDDTKSRMKELSGVK